MFKRSHKKEIRALLELGDPLIIEPVMQLVDELNDERNKLHNRLIGFRSKNKKGVENLPIIKTYLRQRLTTFKDEPILHVYINTYTHRASVRRKEKEAEHLEHVGDYTAPYVIDDVLEDAEYTLSTLEETKH